MTTIGPASLFPQFQADANLKSQTPGRQDRPEHPFRTERPDRPDHGGPENLVQMTRRFVHAAKEILQNGGEFEDIAKLARKVVAEHPALKEFPPFQKIMERIAYNLGGSQGPFVDPPATDATVRDAGSDDTVRKRISLIV